MSHLEAMSLNEARRIAIVAQGLHRPRAEKAHLADLQRVVQDIGIVQIDSVNVFARAHLMPFYSRAGGYDHADLSKLTHFDPSQIAALSAHVPNASTGSQSVESGLRRSQPDLIEYWGHEASFVPSSTREHLQFRMTDFARRFKDRGDLLGSNRATVAEIHRVIIDQGPMSASTMRKTLNHALPDKNNWGWNHSLAQKILQQLFLTGAMTCVGRNAQFERLYDLPEHHGLEHDDDKCDRATGVQNLMEIAAKAHGVGTLNCFADYFRLHKRDAAPALAKLLEAGALRPVRVEGWNDTTYIHKDAIVPHAVTGSALLSPFDPLIWERSRVKSLFGMHYRIEIYVPAAKREYGYYVLPFLLDGALQARVDLKADRKQSRLLVQSVHLESGAPAHTRDALHQELGFASAWLGLETVQYASTADAAQVRKFCN